MPSKTQSIVLGAAVYTVASLTIGFIAVNSGQTGQYLVGVLCCLFALVGPGVTVWHYASTNSLTVPPGTGAALGAITIAAGGAVSYAVQKLLQVVNVYPSDAEMMERQRQQLVAQGMDAEAIEQAMQMGEMFSGIGGAIFNLVILSVVGAIAGAIAASVFKKGPVDELAL